MECYIKCLGQIKNHTVKIKCSCRNISLAGCLNVDQKWRQRKGLPVNPNSFGPLTNIPDYTYMDGRPTPIGSNLRMRLEKQKNMTERMVTLIKEIDFAKERFTRLENEKAAETQKILDNKFKPKGHLLLKKS